MKKYTSCYIMTSDQLLDSIRGLYSKYISPNASFSAVFESLIEYTPRGTRPAFYDLAVSKSTGKIMTREMPDSKWKTVGVDINSYYTHKDFIRDTLDFLYKTNASFLERRVIMTLISGLIVEDSLFANKKQG